MKMQWLQEAITNNAAWCDAIAKSHGMIANWGDAVWFSEHPMPRLYPNLITLSSGASVDEHISTIDSAAPPGWGIKDSYKELTLIDRGFKAVFEAVWYCHLPNQQQSWPNANSPAVKYVTKQDTLDRWVTAWGEGTGIFQPTLLENNDVTLVYTERNGAITGGLATNLSGKSVGISNAFGAPADILECIHAIAKAHPDRGIVGYGDEAEMAMLETVGFQALGELRVWLRI